MNPNRPVDTNYPSSNVPAMVFPTTAQMHPTDAYPAGYTGPAGYVGSHLNTPTHGPATDAYNAAGYPNTSNMSNTSNFGSSTAGGVSNDPTDVAPSKLHGYTDKIMGDIKQGFGAVFSENLREKGMMQKQKGEAELEANRTAHHMKGTAEENEGMAKNNIGAATGNETLRARGEGEKLAGATQRNLY